MTDIDSSTNPLDPRSILSKERCFNLLQRSVFIAYASFEEPTFEHVRTIAKRLQFNALSGTGYLGVTVIH